MDSKEVRSDLKEPLRLPTFLVIGVQKCGTSWLYHMLCQHPEVAVSEPKEVHFFNKTYHYEKGLGWYSQHFPVAPDAKAVGEFTPNYFWTSDDPEEIRESDRTREIPRLVHQALPDARLIVSLRDPVKRAVSAYYHHLRMGRISPRVSILDVAGHYGTVSMGIYDLHLTRWLRHFPADRLLLLIYEEDLADDAKPGTLGRVFRHIGVDDSFKPENIQEGFNVRASAFGMRTARFPPLVRSALDRLVPDFVKGWEAWDIPVREEEVAVLRATFAPHTERLAELLGRELPWG